MITLYDSIYNGQFPPGAAAYAGYVDGNLADQPNADWLARTFPYARHLSIALFADHDADCLDVEAGAARAGDIPGWHARQARRGITRPVVYASAYTMHEEVLPVLAAAGITRAGARLWTAHYGIGEHLCGPGSCGALEVTADGTQWTNAAMGRVLDQSLLRGDFFGTTPAPTWTENLMQQLPVLKQGATGTSVRTVQFQCGERGHPVTVDGVFGPATGQAVRGVQAAAGIATDQVVGPATWAALLAGSA